MWHSSLMKFWVQHRRCICCDFVILLTPHLSLSSCVFLFYWLSIHVVTPGPQRSCGKVMFSLVCVCPRGRYAWSQVPSMDGYIWYTPSTPPQKVHPWKVHTLEGTSQKVHPLPRRYASYWNAFLFRVVIRWFMPHLNAVILRILIHGYILL